MHTVDQAKVLYCPMGRGRGSGERCIAQHCAAWRWIPKTGVRPEVVSNAGIKRVVREDGPVPPTHGYCGLAGRQEET